MVVNLNAQRIGYYSFFSQIQQNPAKGVKFTELGELKAYLYNVYDIYEHLAANSSTLLDHTLSNVYYSQLANRENTQVVVHKPNREVSATLELIFSKMTFAFGMLKSVEFANTNLWNTRKNFSELKPAILEILERVDEGAQRIAKLYYSRDVVWPVIANGEVSGDCPELNYFVLEGILL